MCYTISNANERNREMKYINCNNMEIEVSDEMQMFGLSTLWHLAEREKSSQIKNVLLEAHGIVGDFLSKERRKP